MLLDSSIQKFSKTPDEFLSLKESASLWELEGFWSPKSVINSLLFTQTVLFYIKHPKSKIWISSILAYNCLDYYDVLYIHTHPNYRHKNFATKLLNHLLDYIRQSYMNQIFPQDEPPYIHLEVKPCNLGAIGLYEKFGFKRVDLRKKYYSTGEDAIIYRYDL